MSRTASDQKCGASTQFIFGECTRPVTVERDGKWYCWQHDPERLDRTRRERQWANSARTVRQDAAFEARCVRRDLERAAGFDGLTNDDLQWIVDAGGMAAILSLVESSVGRALP